MSERKINQLIIDTGKNARAERTTRERELQDMDWWKAYNAERSTRNNLSFVWTGETTFASDSGVEKRALEMAGRSDLFSLVDDYYITDQAQEPGRGGDSRSLTIKYGIDTKLQKGHAYYLCLI